MKKDSIKILKSSPKRTSKRTPERTLGCHQRLLLAHAYPYSRYISCDENLESSKAVVNIWICLHVHLFCLKPSWLLCRI